MQSVFIDYNFLALLADWPIGGSFEGKRAGGRGRRGRSLSRRPGTLEHMQRLRMSCASMCNTGQTSRWRASGIHTGKATSYSAISPLSPKSALTLMMMRGQEGSRGQKKTNSTQSAAIKILQKDQYFKPPPSSRSLVATSVPQSVYKARRRY